MRLKHLLAAMVAGVMLLGSAAIPALGATEVTIVLDGETLVPKDVTGAIVNPFEENGTTYLPVRAVSEAYALSVDWDEETETVFIGDKGESPAKGEHINIVLNGAVLEAKDASGTAVYPILRDGTTYLPVRALGEALGKTVVWDGETETVYITTPTAAEDALAAKYYRIVNAKTGKALAALDGSAENGAQLTTVAVDEASEAQLWRLGFVSSGVYNISNGASGKSIDVPSANKDAGTNLIQYTTNGNSNQSWKFEELENGNYVLMVMHSELYADASGDVLVQAARDAQNEAQEWQLVYVKDSMLKNVLETEAFRTLDESVQRGFKTYFFSNLPASRTVANSAESYFVAQDFENLSLAEQQAAIITVLPYTAYGQVSGDKLDQESAPYTIVKEYVDEDYDIWRGAREKCWIYEVEMEGDEPGQLHRFTMASNEENSEMVERGIEALGAFPYAIRQYVHNLYWKNGDAANSYNGGGNAIWIRLQWKPNKSQVIQTLSHELGHVLDSNTLPAGEVWTWVEAMDAVPISSYGSSNQAEDLAEFHRLYWMTLGKDTHSELAVVYPNRLMVLEGMLYKADPEFFASYKASAEKMEQLYQEIQDYGQDSVAGELDYSKYYKIVDVNSGKVMGIKDASSDNNIALMLEEDTGADSQTFQLERSGRFVKIYNKNSGLPIQLSTSAMNGKGAVQYGGQWAVDDKFAVYGDAEKGYTFCSRRYAGMGLSAQDTIVGGNITPTAWKLVPVGEAETMKEYTVQVADSELYLQTPAQQGEKMTAEKAPEGGAQKFYLREVETDVYTLQNAETSFAIDIPGGSVDAGKALIAYELSKNDNQLFTMEAVGTDTYRLRMKHSELYLTVNADGSVTQEELDAGKQQVFVLNEQ